MPDAVRRLYSLAEAGRILGLHPVSLRRFCRKGLLGARRQGHLWKVSADAVEAFQSDLGRWPGARAIDVAAQDVVVGAVPLHAYARQNGLNVKTVYAQARAGRIRAFKNFSGRWWIVPDDAAGTDANKEENP